MSFGNIIGGLLTQGMSSQSHRRLRTGAEHADQSAGIEQMLGAFLGGGRGTAGRPGAGGGSGGFADMASDFLRKGQAGGMSGAKIGGLGALAGGLLGGGLGGAAKGGAMAILGTLALNAWREYQAGQSGSGTAAPGSGRVASGSGAAAPGSGAAASGSGTAAARPAAATEDEINALTAPATEHLILRAMIGAAQVDGHIDQAEMDKLLGHLQEGEITEDERRAAREEASRTVDVEALGREVTRPEVATQVYLAALMAVDIDTEAERDYFRRLARAMRLDQGVVDRLHRMTGAPKA